MSRISTAANNSDALKVVSAVLDSSKDYIEGYATRAMIYEDMKDFDKALEDRNAAIEANNKRFGKGFRGFYGERGRTYLKAGRLKEAVEDFDNTVKESKPMIHYWGLRAEAYHKLGDYKKEIDDLSDLLKEKPQIIDEIILSKPSPDGKTVALLRQRAEAYKLTNQPALAKADLDKAEKLAKTSAESQK